jgi:SAM-dependent methyltransferase
MTNYLAYAKKSFLCHTTRSGSTHSHLNNPSKSIEYINQVFNDYLKYSHLDYSDLKGSTVLEIGPGDNFGVAMNFLIYGARKVVALDKFFSYRDPIQQCRIYKQLRNVLTYPQSKIFDSILQIKENKFKIISDKLEYIHGKGIEDALSLFPSFYFDIIISRAVLEHVANVLKAIYVMDRLLKPQAIMIHHIDFRDHGIFSASGMHPLTFLAIPQVIWKQMTLYSGKPNRVRIDYYRRIFSQMNYELSIIPSFFLPEEFHCSPPTYDGKPGKAALTLLRQVYPKLQPEFAKMNKRDLMVSSAFIVAKKVMINKSH